MVDRIAGVKGMNDLLPLESARWEWLEDRVLSVMRRWGYQGVRTPIVEPTALFVRGLGEATDIVEKEMYSFADRLNGDQLTLRPEGTAGVVRAAIEHNLLYEGGRRLVYLGPMFRHERPQKGRYRQFHQVGVEVLGWPGPDVDAEVILLARALWRELGLCEGQDLHLEINSLGQSAERAAHRQALIEHFDAHASSLDEEALKRLHTNPLRVLDSKHPAVQAVAESAPRLLDFLGAESRAHLQGVCAVLEACGVPYRINPHLVRGMDYYNLTVFEWVTDKLGAQGAVCGGGRYDGLIERLGGKPAPAVGWGLGIERLLLLLDALGRIPAAPGPDVYAIVPDAKAVAPAMVALESLRRAGVRAVMHAATDQGPGSMKAQFRKADASGARHALIFGADELAVGEVTIKSLRSPDVPQERRALAQVSQWAGTLLVGGDNCGLG